MLFSDIFNVNLAFACMACGHERKGDQRGRVGIPVLVNVVIQQRQIRRRRSRKKPKIWTYGGRQAVQISLGEAAVDRINSMMRHCVQRKSQEYISHTCTSPSEIAAVNRTDPMSQHWVWRKSQKKDSRTCMSPAEKAVVKRAKIPLTALRAEKESEGKFTHQCAN